MTPQRNTSRNSSGFALVIVLWILVILVTSGVSLSRAVRLEMRIARNNLMALKARYLAKGAMVMVTDALRRGACLATEIRGLEKEDDKISLLKERLPGFLPDGDEGEFTLFERDDAITIVCENEEERIEVVCRDEAARINVSRIDDRDKDVLKALPGFTDDVIACIMDWIDEDDLVKLVGGNGAENPYYQSLNPPYDCKNGPLDVSEELLLIKGITPVIYWGEDVNGNGILDPNENDGEANYPPDNADEVLDAGIKDLVTTFTDGRINANSAGLGVWTALCEGDKSLAEDIIGIRAGKEKGFASVTELRALVNEDLYRKMSRKMTVTTYVYRVIVTGEMKKQEVKKTIEAVVDVRSGEKSPLLILYWRER